MRRHDKQITDQHIIQDILKKSEICRLGMVDNGEAYIVPVYYAYQDGFIFIHSAPQGRKIELLKKNFQVTFEIEFLSEIIKGEIPCKWSSKYRSVMGKGSLTIESDPKRKQEGLNLIMKKYGAMMPLNYEESALSGMTILLLKINAISGKESGTW